MEQNNYTKFYGSMLVGISIIFLLGLYLEYKESIIKYFSFGFLYCFAIILSYLSTKEYYLQKQSEEVIYKHYFGNYKEPIIIEKSDFDRLNKIADKQSK